jgi:hypothetical protein
MDDIVSEPCIYQAVWKAYDLFGLVYQVPFIVDLDFIDA